MSDQRPKVGAGVLIIQDGQVLLAKRIGSHGDGTWGSLGGHVEFGEKPSETVKREAMEELGIELTKIKFLCCTDAFMGDKHYLDLGFRADIAKGTPIIQKGEETKIEMVEWFSLKDLPEPLFPPVEIYIRAYKTGEVYFELKR